MGLKKVKELKKNRTVRDISCDQPYLFRTKDGLRYLSMCRGTGTTLRCIELDSDWMPNGETFDVPISNEIVELYEVVKVDWKVKEL